MGKLLNCLNDGLIEFINAQKIFFVASGMPTGRLNLSPKGMDTLRVVSPQQVAYLDLTGSGNETAAHLHHDGRLTLMFCSFGDQPSILRLYGRGRVVSKEAPDWAGWRSRFPALPGDRQIIALGIESVQTSCGFAVPQYQFLHERSKLVEWADKKGPAGLRDYRRTRNATSLDGVPTHLVDEPGDAAP